jgi:hypothetical protein
MSKSLILLEESLYCASPCGRSPEREKLREWRKSSTSFLTQTPLLTASDDLNYRYFDIGKKAFPLLNTIVSSYHDK